MKLDGPFITETLFLGNAFYADDLTFSANVEIPLTTLQQIKTIITAHDFLVNEKKVRFKHAGQQQTVTGLVVNQKVNANRKFRKKVRAMRHDAEKNGLIEATNRHFGTERCTPKMVEYFERKLKGYEEFIKITRLIYLSE